MAEILLSLTIIGVVAAITLPSLTGNINERTWNTQRKALFARMSQAISLMPSLNGYGTLSDATSSASAVDTAAETFITAGLSKVLKINNICDNDHLEDCGMPSKINPTTGSAFNLPKKLSELNYGITASIAGLTVKNTKSAAFETANGESVLVFYNPNCTASDVIMTGTSGGSSGAGIEGVYAKQYMCANFIYDLNGSKGPNTVGKDIGMMTVMYSSDSNVVMPLYPKGLSGTYTQAAAAKECSNYDAEFRLPNIDELVSIYYNRKLVGEDIFGSAQYVWSATTIDGTNSWSFGNSYGMKYSQAKTSGLAALCVKRN
ncbi:MAG: hypothetical protein NC390_03105 [Fusobacterium sp.]|nr:hypothetical protein [Fusobacterium sp.]